jgi:hypothetical protein
VLYALRRRNKDEKSTIVPASRGNRRLDPLVYIDRHTS